MTRRSMHRVLKRHTKRCDVRAVSDNIRHFRRVAKMGQPYAIAASLNILKRACGCGPKRMGQRMTPREIVSRCGR